MITVTAAICTRDRPAMCAQAVASILATDGADFELLIVDQSADDTGPECLGRCADDPRARVIRTETRGLSRARNIALVNARAPVVVFTDDDCTVPRDWLRSMAEVFSDDRVAVAFSNVDAGAHDQGSGFIPCYVREATAVVRTPWSKMTARGIGASMAVRRATALQLGGFDPALGPGAPFMSCEEGDLALRALLAGHRVVETAAVAVVHHGFRTWSEGRELTRRDWVGIGAAYSKPIKCGHFSAVPVVLYELLVKGLWEAMSPAFRLRRPQGFKRIGYFMRGFIRGLRVPVDRNTLLFAAVVER